MHNEPWSNSEVSTAGFLKLVQDYTGYVAKTQRHRGDNLVSSRTSWVYPREGWLKVNCDAAMLGPNLVGVGAVVRDAQGRVVTAAVRRYEAGWSVALAEAMAARLGVDLAQRHGCVNLELECDAYTLAKAIAMKTVGRAPLDLIVEDICFIGLSFVNFSVSHVKRGGNTVTHWVARLHPDNGVKQVYFANVPQGVLTLAELDVS